MVILTFEGPDNLGKSTIINKIISNFKDTKDICMMHSTGPHTENAEDPFVYQANVFKELSLKMLVINSSEAQLPHIHDNLLIMDRSWYGEYVYGQIYRKGKKSDILKMIKTNDKSISKIKNCVINLTASAEFIISHDDNKSFTSNMEKDERYYTVKRELDLFEECFKKLPKLNVITINVEGKNNNYRNIDDIYAEIISKLKTLKIDLNE